jgi:hypothetical protein
MVSLLRSVRCNLDVLLLYFNVEFLPRLVNNRPQSPWLVSVRDSLLLTSRVLGFAMRHSPMALQPTKEI